MSSETTKPKLNEHTFTDCQNCGELIFQPWNGRDQDGCNGWRHLIKEVGAYHYYCDKTESDYAEPSNYE